MNMLRIPFKKDHFGINAEDIWMKRILDAQWSVENIFWSPRREKGTPWQLINLSHKKEKGYLPGFMLGVENEE